MKQLPHLRVSRCRLGLVMALGLVLVGAASAAPAGADAAGEAAEATPPLTNAASPHADATLQLTAIPPEATPIMPLHEVRIGMKGYGLSVFHGTKIEPFPVEVISVVANETPKRGAIWIRCTDERMLKSGPVQGMSGSPIFLWDEGEAQVLGQGGRLVGAFAFGFSLVKDCLVGVQPIEYMREAGRRALEQDGGQPGDPVGPATQPRRAAAVTGQRTIATLQQMAMGRQLSPSPQTRLTGISALMRGSAQRNGAAAEPMAVAPPAPATPLPEGPMAEGRVMPLLLPMSVGPAPLADFVAPLLSPMGLQAVAGDGLTSGAPPASIDPDDARLEPGSVLAVPLAFGDLDLSAGGTVTDVLPDGTVLGFGHAMFGQGPIALPMATGFVHFVVPRLSTSFKLAGSLRIAGSLLQDEAAAVAGRGTARFATAPVRVHVEAPGQAPTSYEYHVADHPQLTPILAALVAVRSITAIHDLPTESTVYVDGEVRFTDVEPLKIDSIVAGDGTQGLMFELLPALVAAMQNPHEALKLESMTLRARVEPTLKQGTIISARLDQAQVAPGDEVGINVWMQVYGQGMQRHRLSLKVPAGLPEGDYPLMIGGATSYLAQMMMSRPHLFATRNVEDLMAMLQRVMGVRADTIYATLQLPEKGVAVGRQELPQLPSSRRAMIFTPSSTLATPFMETVETQRHAGVVVDGDVGFVVSVRQRPVAVQPAPALEGRR